jgi:hypothetical protein
MSRRSTLSAFALVTAFGLGALLSSQLPLLNAQPAANAPPSHGKCVGMSAVPSPNNAPATVYRVFEDGTVEVMPAGRGGDWKQIGK